MHKALNMEHKSSTLQSMKGMENASMQAWNMDWNVVSNDAKSWEQAK